MLAVIAAAPWRYGGVELTVQWYLFAGLLAALTCWLIATILRLREQPRRELCLPVAVLPLIGGIALGTLQLLPLTEANGWRQPLPGFSHSKASAQPARAGASGTFLPSIHAQQPQAPASLYPAATRLDLARLIMGLTGFCLGTWLFRTSAAQRWLWIVLGGCGALLALFGIAGTLSPGAGPFAFVSGEEGASFGSFINRNNASGYLNLCLGAAVGLAVPALIKRSRESEDATRPGKHYGKHAWQRSHRSEAATVWQDRLNRWLAWDAGRLSVLAAVALITAGILCAFSRGGVVALCGAALVTGLVAIRARRRTTVAFLAVGGLALSLLLVNWVGLSEDVQDRLATLFAEDITQNGRIEHWQDALRAASAAPMVGTGLGTYRYAYRPHQTRFFEGWFYHAENQYVEALLEGGFLGLLLLLSAIALVAVSLGKLLDGRSRDGAAVAAGLAGVFILTSQGLQALFDFSLYIPANMLALAVVCGALTGSAAARVAEKSWPWRLPAGRPATVLTLAATLLACGLLGLREVSAASQAASARQALPKLNSPTALGAEELDATLTYLQRAAAKRPDDAVLQRELADLWIYRYRLAAYRRLQQAAVAPDTNYKEQLWQLTRPSLLPVQAARLRRRGDDGAWEKLRRDPLVLDSLQPAVQHLRAAQAACPVLPGVYEKLAALAFVATSRGSSGLARELRQRAVRLQPGDPDLLYRAGLLADTAGERTQAYRLWKQSLEHKPRYLEPLLAFAVRDMEPKRLVETILPDSPKLLVDLAEGRYGDGRLSDHPEPLLQRAEQLLEADASLSEAERWHLSARIAGLQERPDAADAAYRRALARKPQQWHWRLQWARLLESQGHLEEAHRQARRCARTVPENKAVRNLLQRLIRAKLRQPAAEASPSQAARAGVVPQ